MIKEVLHNGQLLALIVSAAYKSDGVEFLTPSSFPIQLGVVCHPESYVIRPHLHSDSPRQVTGTQEVLFLRKGKLRVDFFDDERNYLESRILVAGDTILLVSGGHGFEAMEEIEIIEAKTGPFMGDETKTRFEPVDPALIEIRE